MRVRSLALAALRCSGFSRRRPSGGTPRLLRGIAEERDTREQGGWKGYGKISKQRLEQVGVWKSGWSRGEYGRKAGAAGSI